MILFVHKLPNTKNILRKKTIMENHPNSVKVNEVFGHEVQRDEETGHIVDQAGLPLDRSAGMPYETRRADAYLENTDPNSGAAHQYDSAEEAMKARDESIEAARKHVAENLPGYVAMAIEDAESSHGGNTVPTKIDIDRK